MLSHEKKRDSPKALIFISNL